MIPGMLIPILLSIGMGLSENGSILGRFSTLSLITRSLCWELDSYSSKVMNLERSVDTFVGEKAQQITQAFSVLGMIVIGELLRVTSILNCRLYIKFQ